jgi:transcriptional regulator with XRE-family HTH domain
MTRTAAAGTIGEYIRVKRKAADLTQDELAKRAGFVQGAIANWEAGGIAPSSRAVAALARVLPGAAAEEMLTLIEGKAS